MNEKNEHDENSEKDKNEERPEAAEPTYERIRTRHTMRAAPDPDSSDEFTAWCTCLLWRSRLPWTEAEHAAAFADHLAHVRRAARILPADLVDGRFAYLPCADEAAALAVAETWIDLGSARSRLFLDGSGVVISFADVQFPAEVARWALRTGHTAPTAAYLVHALQHLADSDPPH
ncbi:hypothetical protein [Embleya sp. AB8]|uniref:hypothetical protein n=1 Tax=Embleya sp. AB8 TaxID=3156304 RepID=UPI003C771745